MISKLLLPDFFCRNICLEKFIVNYERVEKEALKVKSGYKIKDFDKDNKNVSLVISGIQTYQIEKCSDILFNICKFIYQNADRLTDIYVFLEATHSITIDSSRFWVNVKNEHPKSNYVITHKDFVNKKWKINPGMYKIFSKERKYLDEHVDRYLNILSNEGVHLTINPYEFSTYDINSSIAPALSEALHYFSILKNNQVIYKFYNDNPLVKNKTLFTRYLKEGAYGGSFVSSDYVLKSLDKYDDVIICGTGQEIVKNTIREMYNEDYQIISLHDCSDFIIDDLYDLKQDIFINMQDY